MTVFRATDPPVLSGATTGLRVGLPKRTELGRSERSERAKKNARCLFSLADVWIPFFCREDELVHGP